jgi:HNH endonuclease/Domain of unknown function (DUF222)
MNLQQLKSSELHERMKTLLERENKLNETILIHLIEVDRRKLFLEMAFPSLFDYMTKGIGFSAASAQRRIDAARLMRQIPEAGQKIQAGGISLVQVSKIQAASRLLKKITGTNLSAEAKLDIIKEVENKTVRETDLIIARKLDLPVVTFEKATLQKDESTRLELTFSKQEMEAIENATQLTSHSLASKNVKDLLLYLVDRVIKQKSKPVNSYSKLATLKRNVFQRDVCCQYQDPTTKNLCGSKYFLEVDHIHPKWNDGTDKIDNLRALCSAHNKYRYEIGR